MVLLYLAMQNSFFSTISDAILVGLKVTQRREGGGGGGKHVKSYSK